MFATRNRHYRLTDSRISLKWALTLKSRARDHYVVLIKALPFPLPHLLDVVEQEVVVGELGGAGLALVNLRGRGALVHPEHVVRQDRLKTLQWQSLGPELTERDLLM